MGSLKSICSFRFAPNDQARCYSRQAKLLKCRHRSRNKQSKTLKNDSSPLFYRTTTEKDTSSRLCCLLQSVPVPGTTSICCCCSLGRLRFVVLGNEMTAIQSPHANTIKYDTLPATPRDHIAHPEESIRPASQRHGLHKLLCQRISGYSSRCD